MSSGQALEILGLYWVKVAPTRGALEGIFGANILLYGALSQIFGALYLLYGALSQIFGALFLLHGALSQIFGALYLLYGALDQDIGAVNLLIGLRHRLLQNSRTREDCLIVPLSFALKHGVSERFRCEGEGLGVRSNDERTLTSCPGRGLQKTAP